MTIAERAEQPQEVKQSAMERLPQLAEQLRGIEPVQLEVYVGPPRGAEVERLRQLLRSVANQLRAVDSAYVKRIAEHIEIELGAVP